MVWRHDGQTIGRVGKNFWGLVGNKYKILHNQGNIYYFIKEMSIQHWHRDFISAASFNRKTVQLSIFQETEKLVTSVPRFTDIVRRKSKQLHTSQMYTGSYRLLLKKHPFQLFLLKTEEDSTCLNKNDEKHRYPFSWIMTERNSKSKTLFTGK